MRRKKEQSPENSERDKQPMPFVSKSVFEIKTYRDEAIEVLNYLDSIGENIYDPKREPGMYLKKKRTTNVEKIFSGVAKKEDNNDINDDVIKSIFNKNK